MRTILVTGRNGFVGNALVSALKRKNNVVSVIRATKNGIDYSKEKLITTDIKDLKADMVKEYKIDCIVHLAAKIRGDQDFVEKNNIVISKVVFAIAETLQVPVIFLSSTNVLFHRALGGYACSKKISEELLGKAQVPYLIVRVPLIIGKDSPSIKAIQRFYKLFCFAPLLGPEKGKVQPIHISSLVDFLVTKIKEKKFSHEAINFVGKEIYTYKDVIKNVIPKSKTFRSLTFPYWLSLSLSKLFEFLTIPFVASTEEIKSINMDKIVDTDQQGNVLFAENSNELLFS